LPLERNRPFWKPPWSLEKEQPFGRNTHQSDVIFALFGGKMVEARVFNNYLVTDFQFWSNLVNVYFDGMLRFIKK